MSGFEKIKAGLEDAIAFAQGDETRGKIHTAEEIVARREAAFEDARQIVRKATSRAGSDLPDDVINGAAKKMVEAVYGKRTRP